MSVMARQANVEANGIGDLQRPDETIDLQHLVNQLFRISTGHQQVHGIIDNR